MSDGIRLRKQWYGLDKLQSQADHRLELLKEGLEATTMADGHWSDRVRWITWVGKVEKELEEENK